MEECLINGIPHQLAGIVDFEPTKRAFMKPDFDPIPDLSIKPHLTQPQEVDLILMALAAQDLALSSLMVSSLTAEGALNETQRNAAIAGACDQVCCRWRQDCFGDANVGELSGI